VGSRSGVGRTRPSAGQTDGAGVAASPNRRGPARRADWSHQGWYCGLAHPCWAGRCAIAAGRQGGARVRRPTPESPRRTPATSRLSRGAHSTRDGWPGSGPPAGYQVAMMVMFSATVGLQRGENAVLVVAARSYRIPFAVELPAEPGALASAQRGWGPAGTAGVPAPPNGWERQRRPSLSEARPTHPDRGRVHRRSPHPRCAALGRITRATSRQVDLN
jgi:hypothetical protein